MNLQYEEHDKNESVSTSAPTARSCIVRKIVLDLTVHSYLTAQGFLAIMERGMIQHRERCTSHHPVIARDTNTLLVHVIEAEYPAIYQYIYT